MIKEIFTFLSITILVAAMFSILPSQTAFAASTIVTITSSSSDIVGAGSITITGTASDPTGVQKVEVSVDSGPFLLATGTTSWSFTTDVLSIGSHIIVAKATSNAGLVGIATVPVGRNPHGIAVNPSTNLIYVANTGFDTISVIDGVTNTVTGTVRVGCGCGTGSAEPTDVAVNPLTNLIYASNQGTNTVTVIDGATNSITATVSVGLSPQSVAVNPLTNLIYVTARNSNTVSVIDGVTNTVVATIPAGFGSYGVAVNPSTNLIYVANVNLISVIVIDGTTNTVTSTIPVVNYPFDVAVNPLTNLIYVDNNISNTVTVIDGTTNTVTSTIPVGTPYDVAVNPLTNIIYALHDGTNISLINGATNTIVDTINVTPNGVDVAVNPLTNILYVVNYGYNTVSVINGAGNTDTATFTITVHDPRESVFAFHHTHVSFTQFCTPQGCFSQPIFSDHIHTIAITPPPNITVEATGIDGAQVQYDPSRVISTEQIISNTCTPATGQTFSLGITTVTCSATDAFGFTGTVPFTVNVIDTTAPAVITSGNIVEEATGISGATVNYPQITATDNVGVTSGPICTPSSGSLFSIGTTTVTCTATDSSGNVSAESFNVLVQDTTKPVVSFVSLTPSIVGDSSQVTITKIASDLVGINTVTAQIKGPSPSTDIIGTVTLSLNSGTIQSGTWSGAFTFPSKDIIPDGTYTIDEIVTDVSGNSLSMNDGIITLDRTAPTLSVISITPSFLRPTDLATVTVSASDALSGVSSVTTQDSTLGSLQISLAIISGSTNPGQVGTFQGFITGTLPEGLHDVTVSTKDNAITPNENSITVNNAFTIDATSPTLTLPSDIILEATSSSGAIIQYTVSASDDIDASVPVICDVSSDTLLPFGNTLITCSASDDAGNTSTDSFNVTVVDTTDPTLNMPSDITAEAISATGSSVQYSATAIDIVDGNLIPTCTPSSDSIFSLGLTMVTCSATDATGNTGTSSFSVTIQDTTAPILTLPSNLTLEAPSLTTPVNTGTATATDTVDSVPLVTYSDSTAPGTGQILSVITRTWTATDSLGNSASADQIITLQDTTAPLITAPNDITIISTISVSPLLGTPTVSDNFDSSPIVTNDAPASFAPGTTTTITWTATDHTGNSQSSTQQVIINTPGQATNDITTLANSFGANTNVLGNASALLNDNNPNNDNGACGKLNAFINKINSDNSLSSAEKTQLILAANAIKTSIGC